MIMKKLAKVGKRQKEGQEERKGKAERIVILTVQYYWEVGGERRLSVGNYFLLIYHIQG
jgi:hypothetical protein